jgi:hypothetical protein
MINDGHTPNWIEWDAEKQCRRSYYEISDGVIAIKTEYFVDDLIDANAEARANAPSGWGEMTRVAAIPMNIYQRFVRPALDQRDDRWLAKFINDGDYSKFRTRDGRV